MADAVSKMKEFNPGLSWESFQSPESAVFAYKGT